MKKVLTPRLIVIFTLVLLIGLPLIINAAQKEGPQHQRCINRWEMIKLIDDLNLTEEQEQAIDAIREETEQAVQPLKEQAEALRYQMAETVLAEVIDVARAEEQIQQLIQLDSQIHDIVAHAKLKTAQILSPEQRSQLLEKVKEVHECREQQEPRSGMVPNLFY